MSDGARMMLNLVLASMLAPVILIAVMMPGYVPTRALASIAARTSGDPVPAMVQILRRCGSRQRSGPCSGVTAATLGTTITTFRSWQNDAGFLALTTIRCPPHARCTVEARALVPFSMTRRDAVFAR